MRILLVEDEPHAAQMLAKGLREEAYAVDVVGDGEKAVYQAAITDYDAIILELMDALNQTTDSLFPRHANLE